ncbi:SCO1/SenC-domain-containing protein [Paraphysoderma sedebokerense]|nr:SCO1/SenC-domain-containing protein [Paraphysoderma sedebokerense]
MSLIPFALRQLQSLQRFNKNISCKSIRKFSLSQRQSTNNSLRHCNISSYANYAKFYSTNSSAEQAKKVLDAGRKSGSKFTPQAYTSLGLLVLTGIGIISYFRLEKERIRKEREDANRDQAIGKPNLGGPFKLTDHNGKIFTNEDMKGKFSLVYFGFTNCPDICPEELDKMSEVIDGLDKNKKTEDFVHAVFITCDPKRDTVAAVRDYVKEFHPKLIGLTGSYNDIKSVAKAYRVYFSSPPEEEDADDYLVDHSIFIYLMDPNGQFVEAFGKNKGSQEMVDSIGNYVRRWRNN